MEDLLFRDDQALMREALRLAKKAAASDEVPIGAVIAKNGRIVGRGAVVHDVGCAFPRDVARHVAIAGIGRSFGRSPTASTPHRRPPEHAEQRRNAE